MDAYEISRERIEGMEPVAEGYKAIMWDSGTQREFKYGGGRCREVIRELNSFGWYPKFNNLFDLKGAKDWEYVCIPQVKDKTKKEAWSDMPKEMLKYITSLPEFNAKIFEKITGIKVGEE